jgi:hypothetical protein
VPERSRKKRAADLNRLAASIVNDATDRQPEPTVDEVRAAARALGRRGGLKGGRARADKLGSQERAEIARRAAQARWSKRKGPSNT